MRYFGLFLLLLSHCLIKGQQRFNTEQLKNPKKFGKQIENSIPKTELFEFSNTVENCFLLKNGLRSSKYINVSEWELLKEEVRPQKVAIIFSKYPIRSNGYKVNHKLLFNRLKNLFEIDPLLNDSTLEFEIVLQTNCKNDKQVDSLYHGIAIYYELEDFELDSASTTPIIPDPHAASQLLHKISKFNDLPIELKEDLEGGNEIEKTEILVDYFSEALQTEKRSKPDSIFLQNKKLLIERFIKTYSSSEDSIVFKVFNRNPQWKDALVIADWTGSMYQYGAQALLWHTLNFERSGLSYFTLFNDGNRKREKKIGSTGGIYYEEADNIQKVINLYQLVMLKGGGGDTPENDLEAIIAGIRKYPIHSEVILIADNNACVRDMSLLDLIDVPVKIILCGTSLGNKINPQYLEIAQKTKGSLHTIDLDIYNLEVELNKKGQVVALKDVNLKVGKAPCYYKSKYHSDSYFEHKIYTSIDSLKTNKERVINLDLSDQGLKKAPRIMKKLYQLKYLDLSNNNIKRINKPIYNLNLEYLNLANNKIPEIPFRLGRVSSLKHLDLSNNNIDTLTSLIYPNLKYLTYLNLSNNQISALTRSFDYRYLEYLYLDNNNLMSISSSTFRSRRLKELTLSNNYIEKLPRKIGYLKKLEILNLSNNSLISLPRSIVKLKQLKRLILNGNKFSSKYIEKLKKQLPNTVIDYQ